MHIIQAEDLKKLTLKILIAKGADHENADRVAHSLVLSDLSGVMTHGVFQLTRYLEDVSRGEISPSAKPEIVNETSSTALVRGNWTYGPVSAMYAMEIAMDKADKEGFSIVALVEAHHIGRLGEYAEVAVHRGLFSQIWASGQGVDDPAAVPYGGSKPILHTNPIAIGAPSGQEQPMVIDYATTVVSGSKVLLAHQENKKIDKGWIVDSEGRDTTDPSLLLDGGASHLPFGGHKGYGIMLADELFGRVFSGADSYSNTEKGGLLKHQGVTFIVFKSDLFQSESDFGSTSDELLSKVRSVPPAPGFDEVLVPGDLEAKALSERTKNGIPLNDSLWDVLLDLADGLDISVE